VVAMPDARQLGERGIVVEAGRGSHAPFPVPARQTGRADSCGGRSVMGVREFSTYPAFPDWRRSKH